MKHLKFGLLAAMLSLTGVTAHAQEVNITPDLPSVALTLLGQDVVIERNQDTEHRLDNEFTKTSRKCPPFCIHAMSAGDGVETVGELELISFLETHVSEGKGLLVDSRIPAWYQKGSIPGAINIPFSTLSPKNDYRDRILEALGASQSGEAWDFSDAMNLMLNCNGPWCDQSPQAIGFLLEAGYPAEKLSSYRGGMQLWLMLGLSLAQDPSS